MRLTIWVTVIWATLLLCMWFGGIGNAETWVEGCNICDGDKEGQHVCTSMNCGGMPPTLIWKEREIPTVEKTNWEGLEITWSAVTYESPGVGTVQFGLRSDGIVVWREE